MSTIPFPPDAPARPAEQSSPCSRDVARARSRSSRTASDSYLKVLIRPARGRLTEARAAIWNACIPTGPSPTTSARDTDPTLLAGPAGYTYNPGRGESHGMTRRRCRPSFARCKTQGRVHRWRLEPSESLVGGRCVRPPASGSSDARSGAIVADSGEGLAASALSVLIRAMRGA